MLPDNPIVKRAKKVVDAGMNISLAQLTESIQLNEKLDELISKKYPEFPAFPEIPEHPTTIEVSNLPEIQKVEITNLPEEKDNKEELKLLKEIASELKKKEQYSYDIEIDSTLKEQLKGEKGEPGLSGTSGKDGSPDTAEQVRDKLSSLEGEERLDAKYIKNLPNQKAYGGVRTFQNLLDVNISSPTNGQVPVYNSTNQRWENGAVSGGIADSFETVSKNLDASGATLNYTGEQLDSIDYANGITKTFNYTGNNLTSVVLSGSTPSGIDLTKTLSYTGDNLTGVAYS